MKDPRERSPRAAARLAWTGVALALAAMAAAHGLRTEAERSSAFDLLDSTGLSQRAADRSDEIRGELDPYWIRLAVARTLVTEALDPAAFAALPVRQAVEDAAAVGERLELAGSLAGAAAAARPAVWQAPMLEGAAVYLSWARQGRPELFTQREAWRGPLDRAVALAPGKTEPHRVLATAMLDLWDTLDAGQRAAARPTLEKAFADPSTFARLAPGWLRAADDLETAFALVPSTVTAWTQVERVFADRRDWQAMVEARERRREILEQTLLADLAELEGRVAGGDLDGARGLAVTMAALAPPDRRYAGYVGSAWQLAPAAAASPARRRSLRPWLDWAMAGFVRGRELLPSKVVDRLAVAVGELAPEEKATALLAAGRLAEAEAIARRAEDLNTERWADYCVAAARVLSSRGEHDGARRLLEKLPPIRRRTLPAALVSAEPRGGAGALALAGTEWEATAWLWHGRWATLDMVPAGPGELELGFDVVPSGGAVVEVSMDFAVVWIGVVSAGDTIRLAQQSRSPQALCLAVETVAGGRVAPGAVRLIPGIE